MTVLFLSRAMEEVKNRYLQKNPRLDVTDADFLDIDFVHLTEDVNTRLKIEREKAQKSRELPVKIPQWRKESLPGTPSANTKENLPP